MSSVFITIRDLIQPIELRDVLHICQDNVRTILIAGVSVGVWWLATRKPRGIPPGPRFTLPIVGDLLFLSKKGDNGDIRLPMRRFRKKYGNIFSLYLGTRLVIVVNGYKLLKEVFIKEGEIFSDRPSTFINDHIGQRKGVIGTSGNHWKEQRKFTLETLREFGFGRTILEDKIHEEIEVLVDDIQKHGGKKIDMFRTVQKAISNVISSIIFGKRFEYDDPTFIGFLERLEENFKYLGGTSLFNFIPSLRFLPGDLFNVKKVIKNVRFVESNIFKPAVEEHINNYNEDNTNDFISSYIKEIKKMEKTGQETTIDRDNLEKVIGDLFVAGTETTSTTILWIILYFLHYPKVYEKCYKEIQEVIGSGRLPSMKDKPSMPYNEAVILEVLRVVDIATIGVPHTVSHDTTFQGFTIPKNTIILPNIDSCLSDDAIWGDADKFRPERFIDSNGKVFKPDEFIPFSIGRRICLGKSLAKMELFLFMTTLVQRFDFKSVDDGPLTSLHGVFGITHSPSHYEVRAVPRYI